MELNIVFEDKNILVVEKPSGLVVNRSDTVRVETLQDQLEDYFGLRNDLGPPATPRKLVLPGGLGIGGRAGIVHRLDRETSGLLVVAKSQKVFEFLQKQFKEREVKKEYTTLVHGEVKKEKGTISAEIGRVGKFGKFGLVKEGRASITDYQVHRRYSFKSENFDRVLKKLQLSKNRINYLKTNAIKYSLLKITPKTGRTHQIRVHLKSIGNPVVSDGIYAPSKLLQFDRAWCPRAFLHASYLEFKVSKSKSPVKFNSDISGDLKSALANLTSSG